jgi:quercetin 2,3-dioxygenase
VRLENGTNIKIICGRLGETVGPVHDIVIEPEYLDITVSPQTIYEHETPSGHTVFAYVIEGQGSFSDDPQAVFGNETVILFADGGTVFVETRDVPVRFLLVAGKPLGEPVAWRGPIVMNTQRELDTAFEEYARGTFIR